MINNNLIKLIDVIDLNLNDKFSTLNLTKREKILTHNVKLSEEVGELSNEVLKFLGKQRNTENNSNSNNIELEFADVILSTLILAKSLDVDINNALNNKINIIKNRGGI